MMQPRVIAEEILATFEDPRNGSGPMWCRGSPTIVRDGGRVFASVPETGKDVPPLCNTRWQLFCREDGARWQRVQVNPRFDEREPCPLMRLPGGRIVLSVNTAVSVRSEDKDGRKGYTCEPGLLEFGAADPTRPPTVLKPRWDRNYEFFEHSYRGCAADGSTGEILVLHQVLDADASRATGSSIYSLAWSYRDAAGEWSRQGLLRFPVRGCYPLVALRGRAAYVVAVSDVVEPNAEWRAFKKEVTGREWDYDVRQLFFTWTPDITHVDFSPPLTFASRDDTAGFLLANDMWVAPDGDVHVVYVDRNVWHAFLRDRFFPGLPITVALRYCRIRQGLVVERRTLVECVEDRTTSAQGAKGKEVVTFRSGHLWVSSAVLHATPDGRLFVLYHAAAQGGSPEATGNYVLPLYPPSTQPPVKLPLRHPIKQLFAATQRLGTPASDVIDIYGIGAEEGVIRYAQVRLR